MITQNYIVIGPAYGRDYSSAAKAKADFLAGKDFSMLSIDQGGAYCSRSDFAPGTVVNLRYKKLMSATCVKV
jgi:hypothetical protein